MLADLSPRASIEHVERLSSDLADWYHTGVTADLQVDAFDRIAVQVTAIDVPRLLPRLESIGFQTVAAFAGQHWIEGLLPREALATIGNLADDGLLGVLPNYGGQTGVGSATSQADAVLKSQQVREDRALGYDGTGIRIGVLSDSFNALGGAAADIASGDLPAGGVTLLQDSFVSGNLDEGRAMLQLVHDVAPGATLGFATAFNGQTSYAANIRALATTFNADVIVDDYLFFAEPFFQDGVIAQAIDEVVTQHGVSYFSFAGNFASNAYESTSFTTATDSGVTGLPSSNYYDFDAAAGVDTRQRVTIGLGQRVRFSLQWDDPFYTAGGVDTNLDLYLVDPATNSVVASMTTNNILTQTPVEVLTFNNGSTTTAYDLLIRHVAGPAPGRIKYVAYSNPAVAVNITEFATNSPTIVPHAGATHAVAVAAAPYFNPLVPESFASLGPTTILFDKQGIRLATPEIRNKPDVMSIDGVDNTFFGNDVDGNGLPNFFGSSAAAPHAAAVAALVLQANPGFAPDQVYYRLKSTATDALAPGFDTLSGHGLINALNAVSSLSGFGNHAPQLDNSSDVRLADIAQDATSNNGTLVSTLLTNGSGNLLTDVDTGALRGIAITAADATHGQWQYSTDGGANWLAMGAVSTSQSRLLSDSPMSRVRFVPANGYFTDVFGANLPAITYRGWDRSSGVAGTLIDTTISGGSTPFSVATKSATIRVTNSTFSFSGTTLTAQGTTGLDTIVYQQLSPTVAMIQVNGLTQVFDRAQVTSVILDGRAGDDLFYGLFNAGLSESFTFTPGGLKGIGSDSLSVSVSSMSTLVIYGDTGDSQTFAGSSGDDVAYAYPTAAIVSQATSLTITSGINTTTLANTTGLDVAILIDSAGDDTFVGRTDRSTLIGDGYSITVEGFQQVYLFGSTGHDTADFHDSSGNDVFYGLESFSALSGAGYFYDAIGFDTVRGLSDGGGQDIAVFYDSIGDDVFQGHVTRSVLIGQGYSTEVNAFDFVYALAYGGGHNRGELFDSASNDTLVADGNVATLYTAGAFIQLYNFDAITGHSTGGGDTLQRKATDYALKVDENWAIHP